MATTIRSTPMFFVTLTGLFDWYVSQDSLSPLPAGGPRASAGGLSVLAGALSLGAGSRKLPGLEQLGKGGLVDDGHPELVGPVELGRPWFGPGHHRGRLLGHAAG